MTYARRRIDLKFQMGEGSFGESGDDVLAVSGLRVSASIQRNGDVSLSAAQIRVYGLSLSVMNRLSTLGKPLMQGRQNTVTVSAGDDESGMATVFVGNMTRAWTDLSAPPDGVFLIESYAAILDKLRPLAPTSFPGNATAAVIVSGLAAQMGYNFENAGVDVTLSNPYFAGTGRQQLDAVARAGNFNAYLDDTTNTLAIWPRDGSRGGAIPLITARTGMVGYPRITQNGMAVTTLFNPNISFGRNVQVESILTPAQGTWTVFQLAHELESETPGGKWFTQATCSLLGATPIAR